MTDVKLPQVGEIVAGKYALKRLLGEGGMGVVLAAEHTRLRQDVAIKFLNPEMLGVDEIVRRFDQEARAAATLRSRHVVRVTDVEQTPDGIPYMVMELLHGSDLESERERREKIPYAEAVDFVLQACSALAEAHDAGIVHRDLKPANLFLAQQRDGGEDVPIVKVLDFGISKFLQEGDAKLTSAGAVMGTALYMSPEQIRGDTTIDARTDIWSLGVILYELISGSPPWNGPLTRVAAAVVAERPPPLAELVVLPEPLVALIDRMMSKDAGDRPPSIADVVAALLPFAPRGSVGAEVAEQLSRRAQRSMRSSPDLAAVTMADGGLAHARTAAVVPERSTMTATTSSLPLRRPSKMLGAVVAVALVVAVLILVLAFAFRTPARTVTARPAQPVPEASSAPLPGIEAASTASAVTATGLRDEPTTTAEPPKPFPASRPGAAATLPNPPRSPAVPSIHPTPPPPRPAPPDTKNPVFL